MSEPHALRPDRIRALQSAVAPALALLAGMQLDLFSAIGDGRHTPAEIAARLGVDAERLGRLLYALASTGLLDHEDGHFGNGVEARAFLARGRTGFIGDEHELLSQLWHADLSTAASIRAAGPSARHDFATGDDESAAAFFRGLVPSTLVFGRELATMADFGKIGSVIDVGGGPGGALWALREQHPHLRVTLHELPAGIRLAQAIAANDARACAVVFEPGNMVEAPSSTTHDAVILKAVLQVLSPSDAAATIRNAFASLNPGGMVFISGAGILDDGRLSPANAVFYNLTFMNLYDAGRAYTRAEYAGWLATAGFVDIAFRTMPSGGTLITACRR